MAPMSFIRFPLWLGALLSLLFAMAQAGAPHPSLPAIGSLDGLGVNIHFTDPRPGELEMIREAGFRWVRMDLGWAGTEKEKGVYDFSAHDRLAAALEKNGMKAVFILDYGNALYAEPGENHPFTQRAGTPEYRAAYARWAAAAVSHFAGRGYLFELWNEPNNEGFWKPKVDAEQYAALAKEACVAIEQAAPKEALIGPATSTIDLPFIETCFKAGLLEHWCAVSAHPYRQQNPETVADEYRRLRMLIRRYAPKDRTIPILSGEWGYSTGYPAFAGKSTEEQEKVQADYVARMFLTNIANDVPLSIWYDWHDDGMDPKESEHHFGLVRHEWKQGAPQPYEPKPAYVAVKQLTQELAGLRFNKRLCTELDDSVVLLFGDAERQRIVAWRAVARPYRILLPPLRGKFVCSSGEVLDPPTPFLWAPGRTTPLYISPSEANDMLRIVATWTRLPLDLTTGRDTPATFEISVSNPTSSDQNLALRMYQSVRLSPGSTKAQAFDFYSSPTRREGGGELVKLWIDNVEFGQFVVLTDSEPLRLKVLPALKTRLPVRIENPHGATLAGTLGYFFGIPADTPEFTALSSQEFEVPVSLASTEREKEYALPVANDAPAAYWVAVSLKERHIDVLIELEQHRRIQIPWDRYRFWSDGDAKVSADQSRETTTEDDPQIGEQSVARLRYRTDPGWKFFCLTYEHAEDAKIPDEPKVLGLWLKGDGKGCQTRIRFTDSAGQTFQPDGPKLDFTGWRYVTFPLKPKDAFHFAHWGGPNDGDIHYPIRWDALLVIDNTSRQAVEGEVCVGPATLVY